MAASTLLWVSVNLDVLGISHRRIHSMSSFTWYSTPNITLCCLSMLYHVPVSNSCSGLNTISIILIYSIFVYLCTIHWHSCCCYSLVTVSNSTLSSQAKLLHGKRFQLFKTWISEWNSRIGSDGDFHIFWEGVTLFSKIAVPFHILTSKVWSSPMLLHVFTNTCHFPFGSAHNWIATEWHLAAVL